MMLEICFIYRKPRPEYFSIEKVFYEVRKRLAGIYRITEFTARHSEVTLWKLLQNMLLVSKCRADLYHITGDAHYLTLAVPGSRAILTIHDCVFLLEKNRWKRMVLKKLLLDFPVRHAKIVTTISENSKREIIAHTGCAPGKVIVIPNPVDENIYFSVKEFNQDCPVILFIGTTENKNLPRTIAAIKGISCILDIVGKIPPTQEALLAENGIQYTQSFSISSAELANKYAQADILLFPTTFEGFGLPIIEAQKAGRVVITSNISPMKEVAGEGASLVDPYDIQSIRNALVAVIENSNYRTSLIEKGFKNVERFSSERAAAGYKAVYDKLVNSGK